MEQRRKLASDVLVEGLSLSEACRLAGVTRVTGRKWVKRARESGIDGICERSRAPKRSPFRTDAQIELALLAMKARYPEWGPRKVVPLLHAEQGIEISLRTAERIFSRHGLTAPALPRAELQNFERESCGALLQMDFKGLPRSTPFSILTVLDDHSRYVFGFGPVPDKTGASVKTFLWELFGEHGLPQSMLMDNGDCWGAKSWAPTAFEAWLMKLGIEPIHGRPFHPQTQGKVERFHLTAKTEVGSRLFGPDIQATRRACKEFVNRYNWLRPHDSLAGATPATRYAPFPNKRPDKVPEPQGMPGDIKRKVTENGCITLKGIEYKVGRGLIAEQVHIREETNGQRIFFANFPLAYLSELGPTRTFGER